MESFVDSNGFGSGKSGELSLSFANMEWEGAIMGFLFYGGTQNMFTFIILFANPFS